MQKKGFSVYTIYTLIIINSLPDCNHNKSVIYVNKTRTPMCEIVIDFEVLTTLNSVWLNVEVKK